MCNPICHIYIGNLREQLYMLVTISISFSLVIALFISKIGAFVNRLNMCGYTFSMPDFVITESTGTNHTFMWNLRMNSGIAFLSKGIVALSAWGIVTPNKVFCKSHN